MCSCHAEALKSTKVLLWQLEKLLAGEGREEQVEQVSHPGGGAILGKERELIGLE